MLTTRFRHPHLGEPLLRLAKHPRTWWLSLLLAVTFWLAGAAIVAVFGDRDPPVAVAYFVLALSALGLMAWLFAIISIAARKPDPEGVSLGVLAAVSLTFILGALSFGIFLPDFDIPAVGF